MTRQEALDYDNELKSKLALEAEILGLEESTGSSIVDNYIMVIPDDARKGMVFLGNEAVSYKFGNISMDFKKAIAAGIELLASVSRPSGEFFQLCAAIDCRGAFYPESSEAGDREERGIYCILSSYKKRI